MSYTLKYTGAEIDDILDRAVEGGTIDEALALKAPLESPALTGTPTAPTPAASDNSTKVATTAYADRAAAGAAAAAYPVDSASGAIASFPDGADAIPMKSFVCSIEPIQAGSGDPSPDNIRAISGHNGVNAVVAGVNLFNIDTQTVNDVTLTNNGNGSYTLNNTASANAHFLGVSTLFKAGTYTISATASNWTGLIVRVRDGSNNIISGTTLSANGSATFTLREDMNIRVNITATSGTSFSNVTVTPQLEVGSTATAVKPYSRTTYPVTFYDGSDPLTVYKGSIDLVSGVLTVTHKGVDMGDLTWVYEAGQTRFKTESLASLIAPPTAQSVAVDAICSRYVVVAFSSLANGTLASGTTGNIFVKDSAYTDSDLFTTAVTGQTIVYKLDTPLVYNLTPTEVLSLLGVNNCFNDCGDTEVEYRADTKLYINKVTGGGGAMTLSMAPLGRTGILIDPEVDAPSAEMVVPIEEVVELTEEAEPIEEDE